MAARRRRHSHVRRYRHIAEVLIRHGFGYLIDQLELHHLVPWRSRWFRRSEPARAPSPGERLRHVLEELGPTYVKFGQMLSVRTDLLDPEISAALSRLHDAVPPFPTQEAKRLIEEELGRPLGELFARFDETPLAAASIAQAHRAKLHSGEEIVLKVRRPGIEHVIATDIHMLLGLAHLVKEHLRPELFDPVEMVHEFARVIRRELDLREEGRHVERFADFFKGDEGVVIPKVYWEYSSERLLAIEFIDGVKVSDHEALAAWGIDRRAVARRGAEAFLKQVMIAGYFHGDPHPGNLLVTRDGRVAFIDFGVVGRLSARQREALVDMFIGMVRHDTEAIVLSLRRLGAVGVAVDSEALRKDLGDLIDRHYGKALAEVQIGALLSDLFEVVHRHRIRLPSDFLLLGKAIVTIEGVGKSLDPSFDVAEIAEPFARRLLAERFAPDRLVGQALESARRYARIAARLAPALDESLQKLNSGELEVGFRHTGLDRLITRIDIVGNRISFSLIIAALVIGSSMVIQAQVGPLVMGISLLGLFGFVVAALFGLGLVLSILRSGRL